MPYVVMAYVVMAYIATTQVVAAYVVMASALMTSAVIAHIVIVYVVTALCREDRGGREIVATGRQRVATARHRARQDPVEAQVDGAFDGAAPIRPEHHTRLVGPAAPLAPAGGQATRSKRSGRHRYGLCSYGLSSFFL